MTNSPITKRSFDLEDRTLEFASDVIKLCRKLARDSINNELIRQLIRAAGSVGANYREANDVLSKKDFCHKIGITLREAKESHYWLQLLNEANPDSGNRIKELIQESLELKKIFSSILAKST